MDLSLEALILIITLFIALIGLVFFLLNRRIEIYEPNKVSGKKYNIGFSFPLLFLGFLVLLYRNDTYWVKRYIIFSLFTLGLFTFFFPFFYNRIYIRNCLNSGYLVKNEEELDYLLKKKIIQKEMKSNLLFFA
jgi:hypothetical protein